MDVWYILHTVLVNVYTKIADIKLKHSQVWVLKQLDKNGYQNPSS
jgi:hypothetical protein